jgi:hypothetical protein
VRGLTQNLIGLFPGSGAGGKPLNFTAFADVINLADSPIVLLEGSRTVDEADKPILCCLIVPQTANYHPFSSQSYKPVVSLTKFAQDSKLAFA